MASPPPRGLAAEQIDRQKVAYSIPPLAYIYIAFYSLLESQPRQVLFLLLLSARVYLLRRHCDRYKSRRAGQVTFVPKAMGWSVFHDRGQNLMVARSAAKQLEHVLDGADLE